MRNFQHQKSYHKTKSKEQRNDRDLEGRSGKEEEDLKEDDQENCDYLSEESAN